VLGFDPEGPLVTRSTELPGNSTNFYGLDYDPQGNLINVTTNNQVYHNVGDCLFDPYGLLLGNYSDDSGATHSVYTQWNFGGQWGYYTDIETGLYLLGHRYYAPGTGRFLNRDPIGYAGGENLYNAFGGNPVNNTDTQGLDPQSDNGSSILSVGATASAGLVGPASLRPGMHSETERSKGARSDLRGLNVTLATGLAGMLTDGLLGRLFGRASEAAEAGGATVADAATVARAIPTFEGLSVSEAMTQATKYVDPAVLSRSAQRAATWNANWGTADLQDCVDRFAGSNATSWVTGSGKLIYENASTGVQVVVDLGGKYFRIFKPKSFSSLDGDYLTVWGNNLAGASNATKNMLTHFNIQ
jgi:RHS repeat-associated protein